MSGLQHLIDFVLNEVALCGDQGANLPYVLQKIEEFHQSQHQDVAVTQQQIDPRFKAKIWTWLVNNPEVSVGQNNEWNHLSLDEALQIHSKSTDSGKTGSNDPQIRIFVSTERTWLAVAGHAPDESKVVPLEFALLSIIASHKSKGIAQPDLVKISGQDKRSVPKRTDSLQRKGYIEKRPIQTKAARTSLCTLRQFLQTATPAVDQAQDQEYQPHGDDAQPSAMIDFNSFNDQLFGILREHGIIARDDLKRKLGLKDRWRWKVLSRAVRKWERIGVLKRVRAESQYEKLHPCVKLEREPTATDLELFHEFNFDILSKHGVEKAGAAIPVGLSQEEDVETSFKSLQALEGDTDLIKEEGDAILSKENAEPTRRIVPCWTPDRNLNNQMFDIINATGTKGITNMKLMRVCFGNFFKRPAENLVHRLVDLWQVAQPLHLRHFAVVRDTGMNKTIMFYVHYSAYNFAKIVETGRASWEAVEFPAEKAKKLKINAPPFGTVPELDCDGFPANHLPRGLMKNPYSSLRDGIMAAKPADYTLSSSDPFMVMLPDGQYAVRRRHDKLPPGTKKAEVRRKYTTGRPTGRPKGRPSGAMLAKRARESEAKEERESASKDLSPELNVTEAQGWEEVDETPPPKRAKIKSESLRGLSRKEKLEALGMDENWTEYNALLMDKPTPGVYVTPQGRRRPVGKSRGRPRNSRIAVFKSSKLPKFTWFVKDKNDSDNEDSEDGAMLSHHASVAPSTVEPEASIAPTPNNLSPTKRAQPDQNTPAPSSPPSVSNPNNADTEQPSKRPRLNIAQTENSEKEFDTASFVGVNPATQDISTPRHRDKSLSVQRIGDEQSRTPSKRRRLGSRGIENTAPNQLSSPHSAAPTTGSGPARFKKAASIVSDRNKTPQPTLSRRVPRGLRGKALTEEEQQLLAAPKPLIERGGSISVLRRKVIMEIMEKAGGAYPTGAILWYPFVTLWMKMGHKEKPDMKTVKNAIKQLVDAGHIRQLTFSGKDKKGSMVTKTLLIKADMSPEDPLVKDMQKKFLVMDPYESRPVVCENVEIDPTLTRSSGRPHGEPPRRQKFSFPVEQGAQFNLHQKPAYVVNEETRRIKQIEKRFLKQLEIEAEIEARITAAEREEFGIPGVRRLMTISRPPALDSHVAPQTSIMRPHVDVNAREPHKRRNPIIRANRMMKPISSIGPYAMLMKPPQDFHVATGTFSTGSYVLRGRKPKKTLPIVNVQKSLNELNRLARYTENSAQASETSKRQSFTSFGSRAEKILKWELDNENVFERNLQGQQFIDQVVQDDFESAPLDGNIRFVTDMAPPPPRTPAKPSPQKRSEARRKQKSLLEPSSAEASKEPTPKPKSKQRRARPATDRRLAKLDDTATTTTTPEKEARPATRQRFRRHRSLRTLPDEMIRKMMIAVVAVRVLAGGAESRVIDWHLVTTAFPDHEPSFIESRARQILNKNRLQMAKMQRDFQERFLEAYAKDEVPRIDYSDLQSYDWVALVEWGNTKLDVSTSQRVPDLPATREQFDSVFELREEPITAGDELYQVVHGVTVNHKRNLMARNPFAIPLEQQPSPKLTQRKVEMAQIENAKSWVRANIITPEKTYRPNEAKDILELFGEPLITNATQMLINERVISLISHGPLGPSRNYDISENFLQALGRKRGIDSTQLRRAVEFKSAILDPELQKTGTTELRYNAEDGDILALINLYATGHIQLQPHDAPRDKFGLTDGGYLTRQMDKKRLRFPVKIIPTEKYVFGNPVKDKAAAVIIPPAPSASGPGHPPKIPLWYDINGELEQHLWTMVMGPILGSLVMRPGVNAQSISNMIKPIMGAWETVKILQWMEEVGIVKADGEGENACWRLQESWWMIPT